MTRVLLALVRLAVGRTRGVIRVFRHRRDARMLLGVDDRMLADIGLTRSDLRDAYAEPLWHDPTDVLARRARERRVSRQRQAFEASHDTALRPAATGLEPLHYPSADRSARFLV